MTHVRATVTLLIVVLVVVLSGCDGGNGGGGGGGPTTPADRLAAFDSIAAKFATLPHTDMVADNAALAAHMATMPQFTQAGVAEGGGAWGMFEDGTYHLVINNMPPGPAPEAAALMMPMQLGTGSGLGVPRDGRARLLWGLGTAFWNPVPHIKAMLDKPGTGYLALATDASMASLRLVGHDGIVFIGSHGCAWTDAAGVARVSLTTTDVPTEENLGPAWYGPQLADGSLTTAHAVQNDVNVLEPCYAVTPKWVRNNMTFGGGSLVYVSACWLDAAPFKDACIAQGASLYAGWTAPARGDHAFTAARFVFDCMLAANSGGSYPSASPPPRPWDVDAFAADMKARGIGKSQAPGYPPAELMFTRDGYGEAGALLPSIRYAWVDEAARTGMAKLTIMGAFGEQPPSAGKSVTVGGTPLTILSWKPNAIECDLPISGAGSGGDVVVTASGHQSNAVPLSVWEMQLRINKYFGGLKAEQTYNIRFRADVHSYRFAPGGPADRRGGLAGWVTQDSTATWAMSGSDGVFSWSGSGTLPWRTGEYDTGAGAGMWAHVSIPSSPNCLELEIMGAGATYYVHGEGGTRAEELYEPLPAIGRLYFNSNWQLAAGHVESAFPVTSVEWDQVTPLYGPSTLTPAGLAAVHALTLTP